LSLKIKSILSQDFAERNRKALPKTGGLFAFPLRGRWIGEAETDEV